MTMAIDLTIPCPVHGPRKWHGHVMCTGCGRLYQIEDPSKPRFPPKACACGAAFLDASGAILPDLNAKLRPFCYACFRRVMKRCAGRVPGVPAPAAAEKPE